MTHHYRLWLIAGDAIVRLGFLIAKEGYDPKYQKPDDGTYLSETMWS